MENVDLAFTSYVYVCEFWKRSMQLKIDGSKFYS